MREGLRDAATHAAVVFGGVQVPEGVEVVPIGEGTKGGDDYRRDGGGVGGDGGAEEHLG